MGKLTLNNIQGQFASTTELNNNFDLIEAALENTVSRDGSSPNTMSADLDLNSKDINNINVINAVAVKVSGQSIVPGDTLTVPSATNVPNTPSGDIIATDVQAAINELDTEKVGLAGTETITGDKTLSGTTLISGDAALSGISTLSGTNVLSGTNTLSGTTTISGSLAVTNDITVSKTLVQSQGSDIASATALTLGSDGNSFDITGTTTIQSIGSVGIGTWVVLQFDGILTFAHDPVNLILPGGGDIITVAGDIALMYEYAVGDWRCVSYTKSANSPLNETQISKAWVNFNGSGTVAINDSFNVTSITDNEIGDYTVNFTNAMNNGDYAVLCTMEIGLTDAKSLGVESGTSPTTTQVTIACVSATGANRSDTSVAMVSILSS